MSVIPERARCEIPELAAIDAEIDELFNRRNELNARRAELIDTVAQKVAKFQVGQEFEGRRGKRIRLTRITGDYVHMKDLMDVPITWVRYKGVQLYKNGNIGDESTFYPEDMTLVK